MQRISETTIAVGQSLTSKHGQTSQSLSKISGTSRPFILPAKIPDEGFELGFLLDRAFEPATDEDFAWAHVQIAQNFGKKPIDFAMKFEQLKEYVKDANWSTVRFRKAIKYFLSHHRFEAWTLADVMRMPVDERLQGWDWVLVEQSKNQKAQSMMEAYKIGGQTLWRYETGEDLPFDKVVAHGKVIKKEQAS
jgi:hypothetical protein